MAGMLQDLRYCWRGLLKSPGFLLAAVLTLALGIGANTAVFSVMNAILLNPSGIPHPDRVVALRVRYAKVGDLQNINMSAPDFGDAVTGKDIFTSAAVMQGGAFNYSGDGATPERLVGARVSWQWFDVFWARPHLGRVFRPEEDQPNANHEVVLAYRTWKGRFGSDPAIVGKRLVLNRSPYSRVSIGPIRRNCGSRLHCRPASTSTANSVITKAFSPLRACGPASPAIRRMLTSTFARTSRSRRRVKTAMDGARVGECFAYL